MRVGREDAQLAAGAVGELELDAVETTEHVALGSERDVVPDAAVGELAEALVVLAEVGADAQVPLRQLDEPDGAVTAPAGAAGLDLDRGERGLAVIAPVDVAAAAVDEAGCEQLEEQPLRPAVHDRVGAEERAVPVEGEAEPLELAGHVRGAAVDPVARRLAAGDRAELGGQPEGVEPEGEQDGVALGAAEACVGVADGVAAHVSDVDVARCERGGGLYIEMGLLVGERRRPESLAGLPGGLTTGL